MIERSKRTSVLAPWKVLIVDDDSDVHEATRMALRGVEFRSRSLSFVDAYSGAQALEVLEKNPDIAIIFLDVIMETPDAGLQVARSVRESGNKAVRMIVRTGFPGQVSERQVIVDYDIHDYKEKTDLTLQKLFTTVISALRAYDDMVTLEEHRRGLMGVMEAVSSFDFNEIQRYVSRMLAEFSGLAKLGSDNIAVLSRPSANAQESPVVQASYGSWKNCVEPVVLEDFGPDVLALVEESFSRRRGISGEEGKTLFVHNRGFDLVVFAMGVDAFEHVDEILLELFLMNVCQVISNHRTFSDMLRDRDIVLRSLALRSEGRDENFAVDLSRLSALVSAIAIRLHTTLSFGQDIDIRFSRCIGTASMLLNLGHDDVLGEILFKSSLIRVSETGALGLARDIVSGCHEFFNGTGHPAGLRGDAIPLAARLVSVAYAYVDLTSDSPQRPALSTISAQTVIQQGSGKQFDPRVVDAFIDVVAHDFGI